MARTFAPVITGSAWRTVWLSTQAAARKKHGNDSTGQPKLSNGDAVSLVDAWVAQTGVGGFPLWYQFAAAAYGWNAREVDILDASAKRRDATFSEQLARELWATTETIVAQLDDLPPIPPRIEVKATVFGDPAFLGSVRAALRQDGAQPRLRVKGKIPVACRDDDGNVIPPRLTCREGFELERVPGTLIPVFVCRNKQTGEAETPRLECTNPILLDDPITAVAKSLLRLAMVVGFIWLVVTETGTSRHRARED